MCIVFINERVFKTKGKKEKYAVESIAWKIKVDEICLIHICWFGICSKMEG